jgi:hypothetical protein
MFNFYAQFFSPRNNLPADKNSVRHHSNVRSVTPKYPSKISTSDEGLQYKNSKKSVQLSNC